MESISFISFKHESEYIDRIERYSVVNNKEKAIIYLLLLDEICKNHMEEIYDIKSKNVYLNAINKPWQTESSKKTTRLIFMLSDNCDNLVIENIYPYYISNILQSKYVKYYLEAMRIWCETSSI